MADFLFEVNCKPELIQGQRVAVIGYGSQGRAHAHNLRDSGVDVVIGVREGSATGGEAESAGFTVFSTAKAVQEADWISILTPDVPMAAIFAEQIGPNLSPGKTIIFAHGFGVVFGGITLPELIDCVLVSPKGPGPGLRAEFEHGRGLPALYAVGQDASGFAAERALAYAWGIGCARAGILQTSFREETVTDLFGEQAVLCGGIPALIRAGFETLVAAGYRPEVAYFECLHETRLIVDLLHRGGLTAMNAKISETAEWGGFQTGSRIVTDETRSRMQDVLSEIENGSFAQRWIRENQQGLPTLRTLRQEVRGSQIERVGKEVRRAIPVIEEIE